MVIMRFRGILQYNKRYFRILSRLQLLTLIIIVLVFIIIVSGDSYCVSPSPVISIEQITNHNMASTDVTLLGYDFTPNGTAVLYGIPTFVKVSNMVITANVDENGNTSWTFKVEQMKQYNFYALDENSTYRSSNNITIGPFLNDATPPMEPKPTPTPTPTPTPKPTPGLSSDVTLLAFIVTCIILTTVGKVKK